MRSRNSSKVRQRFTRLVLTALLVAGIIATSAGLVWWRAETSPLVRGERAMQAYSYAEALAAFQEAARNEPSNMLPRLRIVDVYLVKRRYTEAAQELRSIQEREPANPDVWRRHGVLATLQNDRRAANEAWHQILALQPADPEAAYLLGMDVLRSDRIESARTYFHALSSAERGALWQQRARYMLLLIDLASGTVPPGVAEELAYLAEGPDPATADAARKLRDDYAQVTAGDPAYVAMQYVHVLLQQRRSDEIFPLVARLCRSAISRNGAYADAYAYLGYAQWQLGHNDDALLSLNQAIELEPNRAVAHYMLGGLLRSQKRYSAAIIEFSRVLEIDPTTTDAYIDLAAAALQISDFALAELALQRAVEQRPDTLRYRIAAARFYVDRVYRVEQALPHLQAAARIAPQDAEVHDLLGWAHHLTRDNGAAEQRLRTAISLNPASTAAHYHLAVVLEQLGRRAEARAAYARAIDLDHTGEYTERAMQGLKKLE